MARDDEPERLATVPDERLDEVAEERFAAVRVVPADRDDPEGEPDPEDADVPRVPGVRDAAVALGARRSAAGISSVTTAFVSCGISFSR